MKRYILLIPFFLVQWPLATVVTSFLASPTGGSKYNVWGIYTLVLFIDVLTDTVAFLMGRYAKEWLVGRYPKRLSIAPARFILLEEYFRAEGLQTIAIGKLSHTVGLPIMVVAGSARLSWSKFLAVNVSVGALKSAMLVAFGFYYGKHARVLLHYFGGAGVLFAALLGVLIAYFLITKRRRKLRR
jgi:membrane-associated protein